MPILQQKISYNCTEFVRCRTLVNSCSCSLRAIQDCLLNCIYLKSCTLSPQPVENTVITHDRSSNSTFNGPNAFSSRILGVRDFFLFSEELDLIMNYQYVWMCVREGESGMLGSWMTIWLIFVRVSPPLGCAPHRKVCTLRHTQKCAPHIADECHCSLRSDNAVS